MSIIDNDKMWASIIEHPTVSWIGTMVKKALKDQGLQYNQETKEIESIKSEFKIKAGRWYTCIKDWVETNKWHKGGIYKSVWNNFIEKVDLLADDGKSYPWYFEDVFKEYFRPATKEEIQNEQKQNVPKKTEQETKTEWYIALDDVGSYVNSIFGSLPLFGKGDWTTKEKVFHLIPDITEEQFNKFFRPATEEELSHQEVTKSDAQKAREEVIEKAVKYLKNH